MNRKIFATLLGLVFILSSCAYNPNGNFKRSASSKWFDADGFQGSKRMPTYNSKYIEMAKRNMVTGNYETGDDIEEDETGLETEKFDPVTYNMKRYQHMAREDSVRKKRGKTPWYVLDDDSDLEDTRQKLSARDDDAARVALERELRDLKRVMVDTREEISKVKCPYSSTTTAHNIAGPYERSAPIVYKNRESEAVNSGYLSETVSQETTVKAPDKKKHKKKEVKKKAIVD